MTLPVEIPIQNLKRPHPFWASLGILITSAPYAALVVMTSLTLLLFYTTLFQLSTTFEVFFLSSTPLYIAVSISLTLLLSILGGLSITQTIYILYARIGFRRGQGTARNLAGTGLGALAAGCPSCASLLLPALGIAGSLAAFPLAGLEIKLLSLILLGDVLLENSKVIAGDCPLNRPPLMRLEEETGTVVVNLSFAALGSLKPAALILVAVMIVYLLPIIPSQYRVSFASGNSPSTNRNSASAPNTDAAALIAQINPDEGYALPYTYGDIGPKLLQAGAFDLDQFAELYASRGAPLSEAQLQMLREGSNEPIVINQQNAHFLLNLFWALGLTNQNIILEEGPLMTNSQGNVTTFASTGGWTLATKPIPELYSSVLIIPLTDAQQALVEEAASNTYRPCCNNSTLFADCNHGMAMLGLFEVMASQGATLGEMYKAAKYFNAFWFPQQTYDLAVYFEATDGKDFAEIDSKTLVSSQYSSGSGWRSVRQWLAENGKIQEVPGGGGCGV